MAGTFFEFVKGEIIVSVLEFPMNLGPFRTTPMRDCQKNVILLERPPHHREPLRSRPRAPPANTNQYFSTLNV